MSNDEKKNEMKFHPAVNGWYLVLQRHSNIQTINKTSGKGNNNQAVDTQPTMWSKIENKLQSKVKQPMKIKHNHPSIIRDYSVSKRMVYVWETEMKTLMGKIDSPNLYSSPINSLWK